MSELVGTDDATTGEYQYLTGFSHIPGTPGISRFSIPALENDWNLHLKKKTVQTSKQKLEFSMFLHLKIILRQNLYQLWQACGEVPSDLV